MNPADRELLIVVRSALLVLNMFATFNAHSPNQTSFAGVVQIHVVVPGFNHIDFPGSGTF